MSIIQTCVCPKCFRTATIETALEYSVSDNHEEFETRINRVDFNVYCPQCNEWMFDCDVSLVERIIKLNKLGFETIYCCEGHYKVHPEILFNTPYVTFIIPSKYDFLNEFIESIVENDKYKDIVFQSKSIEGNIKIGIYCGSEFSDEEVENMSENDFKHITSEFYLLSMDLLR